MNIQLHKINPFHFKTVLQSCNSCAVVTIGQVRDQVYYKGTLMVVGTKQMEKRHMAAPLSSSFALFDIGEKSASLANLGETSKLPDQERPHPYPSPWETAEKPQGEKGVCYNVISTFGDERTMLTSDFLLLLADPERPLFLEVVPEEHFLRRLLEVIDFEAFRPILETAYKGFGRPPLDCIFVLKLELLARQYRL